MGKTDRMAMFAILASTACAVAENGREAPPNTRPAVLLITLDTTRADHLSPYGYGLVETPVYDRLATEGTPTAAAKSRSSPSSEAPDE